MLMKHLWNEKKKSILFVKSGMIDVGDFSLNKDADANYKENLIVRFQLKQEDSGLVMHIYSLFTSS